MGRLFVVLGGQLLFGSVGILDHGVIHLCTEGGAELRQIFLTQRLLLCFFLVGQCLCLGFSGEGVDAVKLC